PTDSESTETTEVQPSDAPQAETSQEAIPAVGFLVVAFVDENAADEALDEMKRAKKQNEFYFEDAAVIRQDANGKVHYHETGDMSTGRGAGYGAIVGGVLGILGGPAGIALAAGAGAAVGAALAHRDSGFRDESLNTIGVALRPGTSAVAAITSHEFLRAVQQQVSIEDIRTVIRNLSQRISDRLAENMNMAIGLILTEDGLGIKEVAANKDKVEVTGAVITDDLVAVGAGIATADGAAYEIAVATEEGAVVEAGVITDEGAVVVDDVITDEGELIAAAVAVPETATDETAGDSEATADEAGAADEAASTEEAA
ncbi:MAG TPA: DUF1269 domain-containing protein, partial [Anaerolineae bacterium]|nr:DUF1269 domain-containing protein [Anaerolineae bacterium]